MLHFSHPPFLQADNLREFKQLQNLLHLFYHRNKNQHRRSIWWRSFASFRREVGHLLDDADRWMAATSDLSKGVWPKGAKGMKARMALAEKHATHKPQLERKMEQRLSWWADSLVEKWWMYAIFIVVSRVFCHHCVHIYRDIYFPLVGSFTSIQYLLMNHRAFTHILTLNQFTQLGLFLAAALARCSHVTGLTAALERLADAETEALITRFADEEFPTLFGTSETADEEDVGEIVQRRTVETTENRQDSFTASTNPNENTGLGSHDIPRNDVQPQDKRLSWAPKRKTGLIPPMRPTPKRRKGGNAIDDLFSSVS